jgi:hypothetical protein
MRTHSMSHIYVDYDTSPVHALVCQQIQAGGMSFLRANTRTGRTLILLMLAALLPTRREEAATIMKLQGKNGRGERI